AAPDLQAEHEEAARREQEETARREAEQPKKKGFFSRFFGL
ncbi:MAG: entry exclusion protein 1, partial [Rothia mucilaginosa]|nr:entry exclusion protein 1 [Rothia mucilaginosa]